MKAHRLPRGAATPEPADADQERIGRNLEAYVDDLHALRAELEQGLRPLDAGRGKELDVEDVIARGRANHGR